MRRIMRTMATENDETFDFQRDSGRDNPADTTDDDVGMAHQR